MQIQGKVVKEVLYVLVKGELDEYSATYCRGEMDRLFDQKGFSQVVIDLSSLEFMDSTGIGMLIGRYKKLKERNIPIYICNPSRQAEKIFKMSGLYQLMPKIV